MNQSYNTEVGERLRKARKAKRMSMKALGDSVGLHESTVSRYEKGEINALDIDKLKEFAQVLGVSATYLMGYENNVHKPKIISLNQCDEPSAVSKIFDELKRLDLTEQELQDLIDYAKFLKSKRR